MRNWFSLLMLLPLPALSAQAPYIGTYKPLDAQLSLGVDRMASASGQDVAYGLTATPQVSLQWLGFRQGQGLFAGGKVKMVVASYQMWLLANPSATHRKEIPASNENHSAKFEIQFFKGTQLLGSRTLVADKVIGRSDYDWCQKCNDQINPAYAALATDLADIPDNATEVKARLVSTVDLTTGQETSAQTFSQTFPIFYHDDPNPIHVRGAESLSPYDLTKPQFWLLEKSGLKKGKAVQIEAESFVEGRKTGLIWGNTPIRQAYEQTPVCYDRKHPERAKFSDGNDISIAKRTLHYRVDRGPWQTQAPTKQGTFEIPPVQGTRLEIAFEYQFTNNLEKGLFDINRCYQIGSDFEWVPVHPGVKEMPLGTFYDSPKGNLSEGWEIELEP